MFGNVGLCHFKIYYFRLRLRFRYFGFRLRFWLRFGFRDILIHTLILSVIRIVLKLNRIGDNTYELLQCFDFVLDRKSVV